MPDLQESRHILALIYVDSVIYLLENESEDRFVGVPHRRTRYKKYKLISKLYQELRN